MRSLAYRGPGDVGWVDAPAPVLVDATDALVRPTAAAFCDLDRRIARGATPFEPPFALGHEAVGEVVAVGDAAGDAGLAPGTRVVVPFFVSCGTCRRCVAGRPLNCETTPPMASYGNPLGGAWGGLFDDLVRVTFAAHAVVPVPAEVPSPLAAAVGDNLTDAYVAVGPALRERPDSSVLVLGGTPSLSLLIVVFALAVGRGPVTFADPDPERCAMARRLGAHVLEGAFGDRVEGEYDLVVDAHGDPRRGPAVAVRSAAPGGRCHLRSVYFGDVPFPYFDWTQKGLTVEVGLPQIQTHAPAVLELLASGTTQADRVIHPPRPWEAAAEVVHDRAPGKPVFVRD